MKMKIEFKACGRKHIEIFENETEFLKWLVWVQNVEGFQITSINGKKENYL